jgi:hypothetical protein
MEDDILSRLQNKRQRTEDNPWSLAAKAQNGHRPPGEPFNNKKYRKLLAAFITEMNPAFRIVESQGSTTLFNITMHKQNLSHGIQYCKKDCSQ